MTNKQALTELFNEANRLSCEEPKYATHELWEMCKQIEKDLDVLELLKNHLIINCWGDIIYKPKHHYEYISGDECEVFKPNEEDTKIKEWLKNEIY